MTDPTATDAAYAAGYVDGYEAARELRLQELVVAARRITEQDARDAAEGRARDSESGTNVVGIDRRPRAELIAQLRDDLERLDATIDELGE
jgi:hypothetical protein